jgi:hypothetical protein
MIYNKFQYLVRAASSRSKWLISGITSWIILAPGSRPHRFIKKTGTKTIYYVNSRPLLNNFILILLNYSPYIKKKLARLAFRYQLQINEPLPDSYKNLSLRAKGIFHQLIQAKTDLH